MKRRDQADKKCKKTQCNFVYSTIKYQYLDNNIQRVEEKIQTKMKRAYWSYSEIIIMLMDSDILYNGPISVLTF